MWNTPPRVHLVFSQERWTPCDKSEDFPKSLLPLVILVEHFRFPVVIALIYQESPASRGAVFVRAVITAGVDGQGPVRAMAFLETFCRKRP